MTTSALRLDVRCYRTTAWSFEYLRDGISLMIDLLMRYLHYFGQAKEEISVDVLIGQGTARSGLLSGQILEVRFFQDIDHFCLCD